MIRSKWHKNQKRGTVPTASAPRTVIQMDTMAFDQVFAFTGIDIYTKESAVVLRPALTNEDGAAFFNPPGPIALRGTVAMLQPDRDPDFKGSFAQQVYINRFNRTLRKECLD